MGIFGALNSAVSGLRAQSMALENISGNIANSQTIGFKRLDTTFADLVAGTASSVKDQTSGMVLASSRATNSLQGDVKAAGSTTDMAINGDGYFIVQQKIGEVDGHPVLSGVDLYTRRGDFELDKDGYLVNGAGYYLEGLALDPVTGNPSGSVPTVIRFSGDLLQAEPTSVVEYRANLPATPLNANYDSAVIGSEILDPLDFGTNPLNPPAGTGTVIGSDVSTFLDSSISGGAITAYDPAGSPVSVQFRWAKIDSTATGGVDTWNLFYQSDSNAGPAGTAWINSGVDYVFDAAGQMTPAVPSVTLTGLTVNGVLVGDVTVQHGTGGITQYADQNGAIQLTQLSQNGSPSGKLTSIQIADGGRVTANYTNGRVIGLAQIPLAKFNAESQLVRLDGEAFSATDDSGEPILGASGQIVGQSLEASNSDIADEFSKMIITQQAYSANTRVITTASDMLKEVMNIIR
ncbi:MAG: flagellar hook protein FlgE [Bauldia sp.]